ncbi:MAG: DNA-directed RNA polymerase subunit omega [Bacteroidales bacterium OttesenSCG-928-I14]|jgi:DNA-directed RNA polymerase subunit K/omega|nr:DNA-directed RNA polymerase subunit omega [Bacteroidales bacterium OttesenSCG-928-I14]
MIQKRNKIRDSIVTQDINSLSEKTGNVYKSVRIIGKRSNQIASEFKKNLEEKLKEFSFYLDGTEIFENKERIEISRFFERRPKPTLIAIQEFLDNKLSYYDSFEKENNILE